MGEYHNAQNPEENALVKVGRYYQHNRVIRPLLQMIAPGGLSVGGALNSLIGNALALYKEQQYRQFFDALLTQNLVLTEAIIQDNDFIHSYYATTRAALNTRRREKVDLFANLFAKYASQFDTRDQDKFEDALAILDDLSYTEFQLLMILFRHQGRRLPAQGALRMVSEFWDTFAADVEAELAIDREHLPGALARLNRTGLYQTITGAYYDYAGDKGHLTWNFFQFIDAFDLAVGPSQVESDGSDVENGS